MSELASATSSGLTASPRRPTDRVLSLAQSDRAEVVASDSARGKTMPTSTPEFGMSALWQM